MNLKNTVEKIIDYAVYITEPQRIIIFGSMVHGTDNVYSDLDILIISDTLIEKNEASTRIKSFANQFCLKTDVLIYSEEEIEAAKTISDSFLNAIYNSGKIIYKRKENNLV